MKQYPYHFHIALDGSGLNGLEGRAGVCQFLFDPADDSHAYRIGYFDGIAGGHALSVDPSGTLGFLGNTGQHLLLYDARTGEEVARQSTLAFEPNDTSLRGSTHAAWLSDREFVVAIGDWFYRFDVRDLARGHRIGKHAVKLPHAIKRTASGRYLVYGSMDHPLHGEAREVGVFDLQTGRARRIELPATCWHVVTDPRSEVFYCLSFRVLPQAGRDYHEWAMAWLKEYAFEIDAASAKVTRHWSAARDIPAHINSDVALSDGELIFCNGASQTIVFIDRKSFARFRLIDERPALSEVANRWRSVAGQVADALTRGNLVTESRHFVGAMRISRGAILDSVYACQLSDDQTLLFTANRGLNHITVYDYPSNTIRLRVPMPDLQEYVPLPRSADPRLGFHHGWLCSPPGGGASPAAPARATRASARRPRSGSPGSR
jgi:hypothetical protein